MSRARVKVTKTSKRTVTKTKIRKSRNKQNGNKNNCPVCGKFMGSGSHG